MPIHGTTILVPVLLIVRGDYLLTTWLRFAVWTSPSRTVRGASIFKSRSRAVHSRLRRRNLRQRGQADPRMGLCQSTRGHRLRQSRFLSEDHRGCMQIPATNFRFPGSLSLSRRSRARHNLSFSNLPRPLQTKIASENGSLVLGIDGGLGMKASARVLGFKRMAQVLDAARSVPVGRENGKRRRVLVFPPHRATPSPNSLMSVDPKTPSPPSPASSDYMSVDGATPSRRLTRSMAKLMAQSDW